MDWFLLAAAGAVLFVARDIALLATGESRWMTVVWAAVQFFLFFTLGFAAESLSASPPNHFRATKPYAILRDPPRFVVLDPAAVVRFLLWATIFYGRRRPPFVRNAWLIALIPSPVPVFCAGAFVWTALTRASFLEGWSAGAAVGTVWITAVLGAAAIQRRLQRQRSATISDDAQGAVLMIELLLALAIGPGQSWTGYRGEGDSLSGAKNLPLEWGTNHNVAWKADLAGYGQSSPVVWPDSVYVTSVDGPNKEQLVLQSISLASGRAKWAETFASSLPEKSHDRISKAAPTPAVDADRVYALFESGDLFAFTHQGKQAWHRAFAQDYGPFKTNHGIGSSIRLAHGTLFVFLAHMGPSALIAIDPATGKDRWKAKLDPAPSFTTPFAATHDGRALILISAGGGLTAFDAKSGEQLWTRKGKGGRGYGVPSPTVSNGTIVIPSSEKGGTHAIRLTNSDEIAWTAGNATTEFSAALVHLGRVYLVNGVGALFCLELATGRELFTARLPGSHWASAIGAGDRVYFFGVEGKSTVLKAADSFERIAENELAIEGRLYGIAPVNGAILLRTGRQLWKVGGPGDRRPGTGYRSPSRCP